MATNGTRRVKIRKGDQVIVIAGRDNGKRGRVLEVKPIEGRVKVEGVAMIKKHQRASPGTNRGGGIIDREAFIDISNVQLICPGCGKAARVGHRVESDGRKVRFCRKCETEL